MGLGIQAALLLDDGGAASARGSSAWVGPGAGRAGPGRPASGVRAHAHRRIEAASGMAAQRGGACGVSWRARRACARVAAACTAWAAGGSSGAGRAWGRPGRCARACGRRSRDSACAAVAWCERHVLVRRAPRACGLAGVARRAGEGRVSRAGREHRPSAALGGVPERGRGGRRRREEGGERKRKKKEKMGKEKEKGKKEKGKEREREEIEREIHATLITGPVDRVQRSHVRADEATGKGVGVLEIGQLEQRKILGNRVQGFRRILSSTMKKYWKIYFSV